MKILISAFLLALIPLVTAFAQTNCVYCNGSGTVIKDIEVGQYGVNNKYAWCSYCKATKPSSHKHVTCSHCGGTGKRSSTGRSSSGNSGMIDMMLNQMNFNSYSGYPITENEKNALNSLVNQYPDEVKKYIEVRKIMDLAVKEFRYNSGSAYIRQPSLEDIDRKKNYYDKKIYELTQQIHIYDYIKVYVDAAFDAYNKAYLSCRESCSTWDNLNKLKEKAIQDEINRLILLP